MQVFGLRKTTLQPRLFQQACRYASSRRSAASKVRAQAAHVKLASRPVTRSRRSAKQEEDEDDGIRWFEQDVDSGVTRRVAGNPEELEAEELRRKIQALETELQEYRADESDEMLMAALSPEERKKVTQALKNRKTRVTKMTAGLEVSLELPPMSTPLVKRLNSALREAAANRTMVSRRKDLWRWYCRAKHGVPMLPRMMPQKAWQLLWDLQSEDSPTNPDRLLHMEQLLIDMSSADFELMPDQDMVYVDVLISLKKIDLAFARWQEAYDHGSFDLARRAVLAQGINLFAQYGHLDKAHDLLQQLLKNYPDHDPRIVLPLIAANATAGNDHLAFGLYLMLRSNLGPAMTMDDYDAVALTFLDDDKKDLALAVFRDMMLRGKQTFENPRLGVQQESRLFKAVVDRFKLLHDKANTAFEVNNLSLSTMSALPVAWQNRFFYGSWLKKLIGMNQLDAATKVVELMYERGAAPDAKHMNGLVGAFMRSGIPELQAKGEQLAWSMIQQRLEFKWRGRQERRGETVTPMPSVYGTEEGLEIPLHVARPVPRATIETFNVMALHYLVQEKWAYIHHLYRMLRPADLRPDAFFMNHCLHMHLNTKDQKAAWQFFTKQVKWTNPDMETYNTLWLGQLRNLDLRKSSDRSGFPVPRELFALMMSWISDSKKVTTAKEDFTIEICNRIILSFCADKDFAGCLVALHGIARKFGHYPDHEIARSIVTAVSNLPDMYAPTLRARRDRQQMPTSEVRLKNTSKVLATLAKRRASAALENGVDTDQQNIKARQEESLNLLSEFIRVVLKRVSGTADTVEPAIETACREMGLEGISTGDIDATNVL